MNLKRLASTWPGVVGALLSLAAAASGAKAASALAPCQAMVAAVSKSAVKPHAFNRSVDLERLLPPTVRRLEPEVQDSVLTAKAARLFEVASPESVHLQRIAPGVWRAWMIEGTAGCTVEQFFRIAADGSLRRLTAPASFNELCTSSGRTMGAVFGRTALIETDSLAHPDFGLDVEITPWTDSGWGASCRAALRFTDRFELKERFCGDASICAAGAAAVPQLAAVIARSGGRALAGQTIVQMGYPGGRGALATFGATPKTEFPDYSDTQTSLAVTIAGRKMVAHVGVGGVGWRPIGDYLVTLYPPGDGDHPLAGYVVERRLVGLKSATTSIPRPWVNPH